MHKKIEANSFFGLDEINSCFPQHTLSMHFPWASFTPTSQSSISPQANYFRISEYSFSLT